VAERSPGAGDRDDRGVASAFAPVIAQLAIAFVAERSSGAAGNGRLKRRHSIASFRRVDTIALRECDRWDALLGRGDFHIAWRIQRCHARVETDGASPKELSAERGGPRRHASAEAATHAGGSTQPPHAS
jgi:hypothetical protein